MKKTLLLLVFTSLLTGCTYKKIKTQEPILESKDYSASSTSESEITKYDILGRWKSNEKGYPVDIEIQEEKNNSNDIIFTVNSTEKEILHFKKNQNQNLVFLNENENLSYTFSFYEDNNLIISKSTTNKENEGTSRPWILKKITEK